jgi:hypothetical protein
MAVAEVITVGETRSMLTDVLTNPTLKAAIEALQKGDRYAWSARWGDFATYFNFRLSPAGKIARLDIGQAT